MGSNIFVISISVGGPATFIGSYMQHSTEYSQQCSHVSPEFCVANNAIYKGIFVATLMGIIMVYNIGS